MPGIENADLGNDFTPTDDVTTVVDNPAVPVVATPAADTTTATTTEDTSRDDKGRFIPKARFDEAVGKERAEKDALGRRLREYEEREAARNVAFDVTEANKAVKELIKQHTNYLSDGELDKASDVMEKILEAKESISERRAAAQASNTKTAAKEEILYDALVSKLEVEYPQLNPENEAYDKAVVKRVQAMMTGLMQTEKMSVNAALKEAVETLMTPAKTAEKGKADEAGVRRKEEAVKKAVDAKTRQPASSNGVGQDHDKSGGALDASMVTKMTYEEFSKLPEETLAKMRGDFL